MENHIPLEAIPELLRIVKPGKKLFLINSQTPCLDLYIKIVNSDICISVYDKNDVFCFNILHLPLTELFLEYLHTVFQYLNSSDKQGNVVISWILMVKIKNLPEKHLGKDSAFILFINF